MRWKRMFLRLDKRGGCLPLADIKAAAKFAVTYARKGNKSAGRFQAKQRNGSKSPGAA